MHAIESFPSLLLNASWQAAVLILLVLAAQRLFGRWLSPRWRYALWTLVFIRLALPWTTPSPASLFNLVNVGGVPSSIITTTGPSDASAPAVTQPPGTGLETPSGAAATSTSSRISTLGWLAWLWLAGASMLAIYLAITHFRISRSISRRRPLIDARVLNLVEDCKQQMGVRTPVTLVESTDVGSPALFGFVRPRLLLPAGLTQSFSLNDLRYVFLHELGHIKRRDIAAGWLMTALQIVHWFNPLVWLAFRRARADREIACDALVLSHLRKEESEGYGETIIRLLESFGRSKWAPSLAGTVENRNEMKERIRMIARFRKPERGLGLAVALFAVLGLITLTDAQTQRQQPHHGLIGTWVLVESPGETNAISAGSRHKSMTGTHWTVSQTNPANGRIRFHHGGTYTLTGDEYVEHVEFANPSTASLVGKSFKFTIKQEGDTLTLSGVGNPWKEVWRRVNAAAIQPSDAATVNLQGTWRGTEHRGTGSLGAVTIVINGSSLEFRGAGDKEWYKAEFSLNHAHPAQLTAVITECHEPSMVGLKTTAIYEIQGGRITIAANRPGISVVPENFDAPGARKFVLEKQ